ncbi:MAG: hypothetical protein OJF62_002121 [Pseudolabrys sp.]|jgi:hypothetical protein|nr:hypothetical protein [Pseudolabrys sp.]
MPGSSPGMTPGMWSAVALSEMHRRAGTPVDPRRNTGVPGLQRTANALRCARDTSFKTWNHFRPSASG